MDLERHRLDQLPRSLQIDAFLAADRSTDARQRRLDDKPTTGTQGHACGFPFATTSAVVIVGFVD
jgi:hypothetical protein